MVIEYEKISRHNEMILRQKLYKANQLELDVKRIMLAKNKRLKLNVNRSD